MPYRASSYAGPLSLARCGVWGSSIIILILDYDAHLYDHVSFDYDLFGSQMLYSD